MNGNNFSINTYYTILFGNALISVLLIFFKIQEITIWYYIFSLVIFLFILKYNFKNMLFFIRTFFLGIVGFLVISVKMVDSDGLFAYHMHDSQTVEIATLMFLLTNIALFGSEVGFEIGSRIKILKKPIQKNGKKMLFYFFFILIIILAYLVSTTSGSVIGSGITYASEEAAGTKMPISNIPTMANIILFTLVLFYFQFKNHYQSIDMKKYTYMIMFAIIFLLFYSELLRGIRLHALNGIFGLIILYKIYNNENLKLTYKYMLIGVLIFIIIQAFGTLRTIENFSDLSVVFELILESFNKINSTTSKIIFNQGTINNIAATFSGTIYFLENEIIDFHYGKDYLNYILRIPPQFMYPDRPQDLAWIFQNNGYTSGGGYFELAEAYLNFGVFGAFIIPLIISFSISYSYKSFVINKYSIVSSIVFFSIMANLIRGLLYQSFALFKGVVVGLFILLLYLIIEQIFIRRNKL